MHMRHQRGYVGVLVYRKARGHFVILGSSRNLEMIIGHRLGPYYFGGRHLREDQPDTGTILFNCTRARIMNLEHDSGAGGIPLGRSRSEHVLIASRGEPAKKHSLFVFALVTAKGSLPAVGTRTAVIDHRRVHLDALKVSVFIKHHLFHEGIDESLRNRHFLCVRILWRPRRRDKSDDVMNDLLVAGLSLGGLHVDVLLEVGRYFEIAILIGSRRI